MRLPDRPLAFETPKQGPGGITSREAAERGRRFLFALAAFLVSVATGFVLVYVPPVLVIGALGMIAATAFIVLKPFLGLLLYAILYILQPGELFPILSALHLERVVGALTLTGIALGMLRRHGQLMMDASDQTRWLWIFTGAVLLSVPFSFWRARALDVFVEMLKIVSFYIMIVHLIDTRKRLRVFLWTYLCLMLYVGTSSLVNYFSGHYLFAQGIDRAVGLTSAGGGPNELGTTMAVTLPILILLIGGESSKFGKLAALTAVPVCAVAMLLTGSRASFLACLTGLLVLWWRSRRRLLWGAVGLTVCVAGFVLLPSQYKTRYETTTHKSLDASSTYRIKTWLTGVEMMIDRPIFGVGAGCFGAARGMSYSSSGRRSFIESHSLYVQVLSELGIVGACCFFTFAAKFLANNRRTLRRLLTSDGWRWEAALLQGMFVGFMVLFVSGVFGHNLFRRTWYIYAALGLVVWRLDRARSAIPEPKP